MAARVCYVAAVLFIQFYYSRHLSKEANGSYQKYFIVAGFCGVVLAAGLPYIIGLLPTAGFFKGVKQLLGKATIIYLVLALASVVLAGFVAQSVLLFCILAGIIACLAGYTVAEAMLLKLGGDKVVFGTNLAFAAVFLPVHILLAPYNSVAPVLCGWLLLAGLRLLVVVIVLRWQARKMAPAGDAFAVGGYYRQWLWLGSNELLENVSTYIDKLLLAFILSKQLELYAVYVTGTYEIPVFTILVSVLGLQFNIQHSNRQGGEDESVSVFKAGSLFTALFMFPVFCFLFFFCGDVFHALLGHKYDASIPLFRLTALVVPVRIAYYGALIQVKGKGKYILFGSALSFCIYAVLAPVFYWQASLIGIVIAGVIATYFQAGYYLVVSARVWRLRVCEVFPFVALLVMLLLNAAVFFAVWYLPKGMLLTQRLLLAGGVTAVMALVNYFAIYKTYARRTGIA